MNATHLHLLVNHLAIVGSALGTLVLVYGIIVKSASTRIAAYGLFVIASIGAAVTFLTGESAEEAVERIAGVSENVIERHEDTAGIALGALLILGFVSLIALYLTIKKSSLTGRVAWITFFISIVSFSLIARTGYLGGQIRHTELNSTATTNEQSVDDD